MNRDRVIATTSVLVGALGVIALVFVPEIRNGIGLGDSPPPTDSGYVAPTPTTKPALQTNNTQLSGPRDDRPKSKPRQDGSKASGGPEIDSVGAISAKAWQTIVIKGTHFGSAQPYNGCSDFLRVTDLTDNRVFGLPAPNRFCFPSILVTSWTDTQIVIEGFPNFKQGEDAFKIGDVIKIQVANPSQQGWDTTRENFNGAPAAWYAVRVQSER
jgi:hypothetical protein